MATKSELINLEVKGKPFKEAVDFLRQKAKVPTAAWHEMIGQYHAKAFTVAGAVKDSLLTDFYEGVNAAIAKGETLEQFRKRFDDTVARHGWSYNGSRGWRSRLIYNTNMQTAYQAGRYNQLQEMTDAAPYWQYSARNDGRTRPQHRQWDGLIISADDPWWDTHYPPNGWNCRCRVWPRTKGDLKRAGKSGPDQAPALEREERTIAATGEVVKVPAGIDTGWDYNVGKSAFGQRVSSEAWKESQKAANWEPLIKSGPAEFGRPARLPIEPAPAPMGKPAASAKEVEQLLVAALGGSERLIRLADPRHAGFEHEVLVIAERLSAHIDPRRATDIPFLVDLLEKPYEVWQSFERNKITGKVILRTRYVKALDLGKGRSEVFVADSRDGLLKSYTFVPTAKINYAQNQRKGVLLFGRE